MIKAWCERCPSVYNVYMIKVCCLSYKLFFTGFNKACRGVAATSFPQGVFCVCDLLAIFLFSPWSVCVFIIFYLVFYASCVHCLNLTRVSLGVSASPVLSLWWPPCLHSPTLFLSLSIYIWSSSCACAVFLTVWSWSCQWSTGQPVGPWACCQSQHPPAPESGTRGTCSSPPVAGVWFCRAS